MRHSLILPILALFTFLPGFAGDDLNAKLGKILTDAFPADQPGAAAIVIRDGKVLSNATTSFLLVEPGRKIEAESITIHVGGGAVNAGERLADLENKLTNLENYIAPTSDLAAQLAKLTN